MYHLRFPFLIIAYVTFPVKYMSDNLTFIFWRIKIRLFLDSPHSLIAIKQKTILIDLQDCLLTYLSNCNDWTAESMASFTCSYVSPP